jgi:NAD(P)-dependent dehydrogenase (short-subunit alcohol dehydrogenase family)
VSGRLGGQTAIVTGAGSGIGRATARLFAAEGAEVLIVDRDPAALETTKTLMMQSGTTPITAVADAGDEADVARFASHAMAEWGTIDVLYANAGVSGGMVPFLANTAALWMDVLRTNLLGPFLAIQAVAPHMVARGSGSIICTASVAGLRANAAGAPYSASKAGVISLVQTAADALAGTGVRVNAICPGLIETGMTAPMFERARARGTGAKIGQLNPLRRAGGPEEIAGAALFLASAESSYVNGQAIAVDGGLSSTHPFAARRS